MKLPYSYGKVIICRTCCFSLSLRWNALQDKDAVGFMVCSASTVSTTASAQMSTGTKLSHSQGWATLPLIKGVTLSAEAPTLFCLSVPVNDRRGESKISWVAKRENVGTGQNLNFLALPCPTKFNSAHLQSLCDMRNCLEQVLNWECAIHSFPEEVYF